MHLYNATSLDVPFDNLLLSRQGTTLLTGIFAGLVLLLSAIGMYGVLSYEVQQRRREIGIRSAIGASPPQILTLVLRQGLSKTGLGLSLGVVGSYYLNGFLESQLFDVTALDAGTYAAGLVLLLLTAFVATYLPARRAVKVDPVESLRLE